MMTAYAVTSLGQLRQKGAWRLDQAHSENFARVIFLSRGAGRAEMSFIPRGLTAPCVVFVPGGQIFSLELHAQVLGYCVSVRDATAPAWPESGFCIKLKNPDQQVDLTSILENLSRHGLGAGFDLRRQGYGLLLAGALADLRAGDPSANARLDRARLLVKAFGHLLEREFTKSPSIADLASALDVTPTHLSRVCREVSGRTALALVNERIMHEARRRLADTDDTARQIAADLGFASAAYFTRAFGQETGQSPSEFRAALRGAA